jgi:AAA family ATP:ADP antiporter
MWTNIAVLAVQALIAAPLVRRLGPGLVLCVLPLVQLGGLCALAFAPSLATLAAFAIASRTATHGLTRPARELLFTIVPREDKYRAKNIIDTTCYRFGDFVASWIMLAGASAGVMVATIVPLALVWLALALSLGSRFKETP